MRQEALEHQAVEVQRGLMATQHLVIREHQEKMVHLVPQEHKASQELVTEDVLDQKETKEHRVEVTRGKMATQEHHTLADQVQRDNLVMLDLQVLEVRKGQLLRAGQHIKFQ